MGAAASVVKRVRDLLTVNDTAGTYPPSYYASAAKHLGGFDAIAGDVSCDVCVIGGGFTGLSTALHLAKRGYDVRLVEAQRVGFGASGRNGGQVGQGQRLDQDELEAKFGLERAKELWAIGTRAVELVRELASSDLVHADFHPGIIHADHRERFVRHSREYVDKLNTQYDYPHVRFLDQEEMRATVNSPVYFGGSLDTRSGHIDPLEFVLGLARMAVAQGAKLHENSRVTKIETGAKVKIHTDQSCITADQLVLACNGYIGDLHSDVARRVMPINNYVVATAPMSPEQQEQIIKGNVAVADSKFVVNYFRFSDDNRLLFGGTESYGYRFPKDIAKQVRKPLGEIFPQLADMQIDHAWGGTLGITMNRLPHYERYAGNILSMSGFSGSGVALGTLSGQIAAEAIAGQSERFDVMAQIPTPHFPGGPRMQHPMLILAMLWYSLRDKL
ncbi:FAD-dependent oxidoreductase [Falsihalocynthiibacter sp. BN13B15]|uniref:NAD(P)/FAD-dependent oxidoreductase n=1 Tax=Falsihalocynthiibacter sp. BN13B15 TaxID=3240871 RepID=UPI00351082E3